MKNLKNKDLRQFGIVLGLILGVFGGIYFLKGHQTAYLRFLSVAVIILVAGIFVPRVLRPVYAVFIKIARVIGWVNTRILLFLIYFLILTPIGFIRRLFGNDPMDRKIDKSAQSYWIKREPAAATPESMEKQF